MGYNKSNTSPLLKIFQLRADELVKRTPQLKYTLRTVRRSDRNPSP
jgi:LysR family hca operon transcriptional activator